jgi:hypothetical protein
MNIILENRENFTKKNFSLWSKVWWLTHLIPATPEVEAGDHKLEACQDKVRENLIQEQNMKTKGYGVTQVVEGMCSMCEALC